MTVYKVTMLDGTAVECESKPFDFVRFEREFKIPFQVVGADAGKGEMHLEHLYWLAFVAWKRQTNSADITFDDWGELVSEIDVIADEDDEAPLDRTA
jgi:hypothetical protein